MLDSPFLPTVNFLKPIRVFMVIFLIIVKVNAFIWVSYNYKEQTILKDLTAIHVIKRSIDLQLWIMVNGVWY